MSQLMGAYLWLLCQVCLLLVVPRCDSQTPADRHCKSLDTVPEELSSLSQECSQGTNCGDHIALISVNGHSLVRRDHTAFPDSGDNNPRERESIPVLAALLVHSTALLKDCAN